jgi:alanyl-tRNA synthetase
MAYTTNFKSRRDYRIKNTSNEVKTYEEQNKTNIAIRVIVDHVRSGFAIADGQLPQIRQDM